MTAPAAPWAAMIGPGSTCHRPIHDARRGRGITHKSGDHPYSRAARLARLSSACIGDHRACARRAAGSANPTSSATVRVFVEINLLRTGNPKDRIPAGEMFNQCCNFCDASQLPLPASMREVKDALEQLGFTSTKSSNMYWIGVRFLEDG